MSSFGLDTRSGLWILFSVQLLCVLFFLGDAIGDLTAVEQIAGLRESDGFEILIVIVLIFSLAFTGLSIRDLLRRNAKVESQLKAASGAFAEILNDHFDQWSLTASEKDVALLAIKGLGIGEIARVRDTRDGTIKAQLNAIYRKASVNGRPQLISLFVEELMGEALAAPVRP